MKMNFRDKLRMLVIYSNLENIPGGKDIIQQLGQLECLRGTTLEDRYSKFDYIKRENSWAEVHFKTIES